MKWFRNIALSCISVLAAAGCAKEELHPDYPASDVPIFFRGKVESKSIFEPDNFQSENNTIVVNDKFEYNGNSLWYFKNEDARFDGTFWNYWEDDNPSRPKYWSAEGIHSFTAFTKKSADGSNISATQATYNFADKSITVSPWTLSLSNQFDFCYGSQTRDLNTSRDHSPVNIQMKHLFAAVCFKVFNQTVETTTSKNYIQIRNFALRNVYDRGSASIQYDSEASLGTLSRSVGSNTDQFAVKEINTNIDYNIPFPIHKKQGKVGEDGFLLMWPHDSDQYKNIQIRLTYKNSSNKDVQKSFNLGDLKTGASRWQAGYKYLYNIYIKDEYISFTLEVVPWEYDDVILED